MTGQIKGVTHVPWRSRPTPRRVLAGPRKRKQKRQQPAAGMTRRDLLKLLVPVVTFVAMAAPDDDSDDGQLNVGDEGGA